MLQNHLHPTEQTIYSLSMLGFIALVALLPWEPGAHARSSSGGIATVTQQRSAVRMVTASVEEANNFAAARLCRGVMSSASRCASFVPTATL